MLDFSLYGFISRMKLRRHRRRRRGYLLGNGIFVFMILSMLMLLLLLHSATTMQIYNLFTLKQSKLCQKITLERFAYLLAFTFNTCELVLWANGNAAMLYLSLVFSSVRVDEIGKYLRISLRRCVAPKASTKSLYSICIDVCANVYMRARRKESPSSYVYTTQKSDETKKKQRVQKTR